MHIRSAIPSDASDIAHVHVESYNVTPETGNTIPIMTKCVGHDETITLHREKHHLIAEIKEKRKENESCHFWS